MNELILSNIFFVLLALVVFFFYLTLNVGAAADARVEEIRNAFDDFEDRLKTLEDSLKVLESDFHDKFDDDDIDIDF